MGEKELVNDNVVFEIEQIKQVKLNVEYILMLVEQYLEAKNAAQPRKSGVTSSVRSIQTLVCATRRT